jgi:formylglycine-generating enzyme required for sulfatase activity
MRKIMAQNVEWTMGSVSEEGRTANHETAHHVTLTNNYYIGVFPVTQAQWTLVATNSSAEAYFKFEGEKAMRPMETVSYNEIRMSAGSREPDANARDWPEAPFAGSFLDLLRQKTGISFDLPSEAQWEFAARAGNGEGKWGDGSLYMSSVKDSHLDRLGRYNQNVVVTSPNVLTPSADGGTAIVGTYEPNAWGLYDMHGNVWEFCLDWFHDDITLLNGRVNITASSWKVGRGGAWYLEAMHCRSAQRYKLSPNARDESYGFRLACPCDVTE